MGAGDVLWYAYIWLVLTVIGSILLNSIVEHVSPRPAKGEGGDESAL